MCLHTCQYSVYELSHSIIGPGVQILTLLYWLILYSSCLPSFKTIPAIQTNRFQGVSFPLGATQINWFKPQELTVWYRIASSFVKTITAIQLSSFQCISLLPRPFISAQYSDPKQNNQLLFAFFQEHCSHSYTHNLSSFLQGLFLLVHYTKPQEQCNQLLLSFFKENYNHSYTHLILYTSIFNTIKVIYTSRLALCFPSFKTIY